MCLINSVDNSVLRYLLSRDDCDLNNPWNRDDPNEKPVHLAARAAEADPEALGMLLDHPSCSADDVSGKWKNALASPLQGKS